MARIFSKKRYRRGGIIELTLPTVFFVLLVVGLMVGSGSVSHSVNSEQLKSAEQAVRRATVQCYALEGRYPATVDYLSQNYGLSVDTKRYVVHYQHLGSNLMPQISVFAIEPSTEGSMK